MERLEKEIAELEIITKLEAQKRKAAYTRMKENVSKTEHELSLYKL